MAQGFHDFTAGELLTAANVSDYLMKQSVMSFASAAARDTALSGELAQGQITDLRDVDALQRYNGTTQNTIYQAAAAWSVAWSNVTVGAGGSVAAVYARSGPMVFLECRFTFGTGSAVSGAIGATLPIASPSAARAPGGAARFFDSSAATFYPGHVRLTGTTTLQVDVVGEVTNVNTLAATSGTVPFIWANNDYVDFTIAYVSAGGT